MAKFPVIGKAFDKNFPKYTKNQVKANDPGLKVEKKLFHSADQMGVEITIKYGNGSVKTTANSTDLLRVCTVRLNDALPGVPDAKYVLTKEQYEIFSKVSDTVTAALTRKVTKKVRELEKLAKKRELEKAKAEKAKAKAKKTTKKAK